MSGESVHVHLDLVATLIGKLLRLQGTGLFDCPSGVLVGSVCVVVVVVVVDGDGIIVYKNGV